MNFCCIKSNGSKVRGVKTDCHLFVFHSLPQLMDVVRSNYEAMIDRAHGGPNFMMHSGISQASEYDDPPGLREKAEYLLREWVNLYHSAAAGRDSTKAFSAFVGQVNPPNSPFAC